MSRFEPAKPFNIGDTELYTWFERDRAHIELRNRNTDRTIIEWWDEAVDELVQDGFVSDKHWIMGRLMNERGLHVDVYNYARDLGILTKKALAA
jgi:hypothetical protein